MTCARVMRGISSIANADTPASAIVFSAASLPYGSMIATTSAPRLYCGSSDASGRFTLMMMSASFSASALTVAPPAVNSESGRPDWTPAPGPTATSAPSALNFLMVSGDAATRGSDGSISLATAIFMRPPLARTHRLALFPLGWNPVWRPARGQIFAPRRKTQRGVDGSGQENRHHGDDEDDGGRAVLHQHDETFIGLLMRFVVVAVGGGVGHFAMVCHWSPQSVKSLFVRADTAIPPAGQRRSANMPGPYRLIGEANYPESGLTDHEIKAAGEPPFVLGGADQQFLAKQAVGTVLGLTGEIKLSSQHASPAR